MKEEGAQGSGPRRVTDRFFSRIPEIQKQMLKDVQAGFDGDPAAQSREEIIFSYPGLFAVYVYRTAHVLYEEKIPFIPHGSCPSMPTDGPGSISIREPGSGNISSSTTGTGIVIGETTEIGDYVKLYQGGNAGSPVHPERTAACRTETASDHRGSCDDLFQFHSAGRGYGDRRALHYRRKYVYHKIRSALYESQRQESGADFQDAGGTQREERSLGVGKLKYLYLRDGK